MRQLIIEEKYREDEQMCQEIKSDLQMLKKQLDNYEYNEDNYTTKFDEWLDETFTGIKIGEIPFYPSKILEKLDPTAYNCWLTEYADEQFAHDKTSDSAYVELEEMITDLEDELQALINEMHPRDIH